MLICPASKTSLQDSRTSESSPVYREVCFIEIVSCINYNSYNYCNSTCESV